MKIRFGLGAVIAASVLASLAGCSAQGSEQAESDLTTAERTVTKLVAGIDYTCVVRSDKTVACVGYGMRGAPEVAVAELSGGTRHVCALALGPTPDRGGPEAGGALCWGDNSYGQSAAPSHPLPEGAPADAVPAPYRFTHVAAGTLHTCGILAEPITIPGTPAVETPPTPATPDTNYVVGSAYCWGGDDAAVASKPDVVLGQLAASQDNTCGIKGDNTLECWGAETDILANKPAGTFKQLAMSFEHACALKTDGAAACWGGTNTFNENDVPEGTKFSQVVVGRYFACGLVAEGDAAGTAKCWGFAEGGRTTPPADKFVQIVAGESHACGLLDDLKTLKCWGLNDYGEAPASVELAAPTPPVPPEDPPAPPRQPPVVTR